MAYLVFACVKWRYFYFLSFQQISVTILISAEDITEWQLPGKMRVHEGTTSGLWQSYLHIMPGVNYWFSAREHHGQEAGAMPVTEQWTPRGMKGEHRGGEKTITGVQGRQRDRATQAEEIAEKVLEIGEKNTFRSKFHHLVYILSAWFGTFCIFHVSTSYF